MITIEERVKRIIIDKLGVEEKEVVSNAKFVEDLGADPMDVVDIIMAIEKEFGFEVPDKFIGEIKTVQDAVDSILRYADL